LLVCLNSLTRYAASFAGWFLSALTNTHLTTTLRLSLGATLLLGALLQLLSQFLRFWNPPFGLFATTFFLTSLGQAYQDSYSNTFVANVPGAHRWLGFIHAMYMLGCLIGPFVATPIAGHSRWYYTYAVEAGLGAVNVAFVCFAFKDDLLGRQKRIATAPGRDQEMRTTATAPNAELGTTSRSRNKQAFIEIQQTLKLKAVWLMSVYFFFFLGAVITAGGLPFSSPPSKLSTLTNTPGWVVEYLIRARHTPPKTTGYISAAYNTGGFLGRLLLAEPTHRFGERRMILIYAVLCLIIQILFWRINNLPANFILFSLLGFFDGPFFPAGISVASKLCPAELRTTSLGFIFVIGQAGASLFPVITGIVAAKAGVKVLQPILVGLFGCVIVSWWVTPRVKKEREN
jgi:fucose permease